MSEAWWNRARERGHEALGSLRVAVYGSGGAPFHHAALAAHFGAAPMVRTAEQIRSGGLDDTDVIVFPGGGAYAMGGMLDPLGVEGAKAIREWVAAGGMYIGSCAGSFLPAKVSESYWNTHPEARELHMVPAELANGSDSEWEGLTSPGVGRIVAQVTDPDHWLASEMPERFELIHYNGPMFDVDGENGQVAGVAGFVARTPDFTPSETFFGEPEPEQTLFDVCAAGGAYTAIASQFGHGTVVLYGSHPEFGFDTLQLGWGEGSTLFLNALLHQAHKCTHRAGSSETPSTRADTDGIGKLDALAKNLQHIAVDLEDLARRDTHAWLEGGASPRFLGLTPAALWARGLREGADTARRTSEYLLEIAAKADPTALAAHRAWLDTAVPAGQDYGFAGIEQLTERIRTVIRTAADRLDRDPTPLAHAYDQLDSHPYQLAVGSYLSGIGLISCAALAATVVGLALAPDVPTPTGPRREQVSARPGGAQ